MRDRKDLLGISELTCLFDTFVAIEFLRVFTWHTLQEQRVGKTVKVIKKNRGAQQRASSRVEWDKDIVISMENSFCFQEKSRVRTVLVLPSYLRFYLSSLLFRNLLECHCLQSCPLVFHWTWWSLWRQQPLGFCKHSSTARDFFFSKLLIVCSSSSVVELSLLMLSKLSQVVKEGLLLLSLSGKAVNLVLYLPLLEA